MILRAARSKPRGARNCDCVRRTIFTCCRSVEAPQSKCRGWDASRRRRSTRGCARSLRHGSRRRSSPTDCSPKARCVSSRPGFLAKPANCKLGFVPMGSTSECRRVVYRVATMTPVFRKTPVIEAGRLKPEARRDAQSPMAVPARTRRPSIRPTRYSCKGIYCGCAFAIRLPAHAWTKLLCRGMCECGRPGPPILPSLV